MTSNGVNLETLTISEARRALDAKEYSALDLTNAYLESIASRDPELHAYLEVWGDSAREEAQRSDERIAKGDVTPLTGIPIALKDNILIQGRVASAASKILENYKAVYDSTVVQKLKAAGAIFLGRTNLDEFAMGSSTENSAFGTTKNPHDTSRVPGGSSGGSSAAVAAGMALGALGSDTGGSIRQPASLCGVVGLKPTYGAVSRSGLIAFGSSLDQIGPLTKTVEDAKFIFDAIRGRDPLDSTSQDFPVPPPHNKRIGVPRAFLKEGIDPDVQQGFEKTLEALQSAGYEIVEVDLPNLAASLGAYYVINPAEASSNLARFDGIRYGLSVQADTIGEVYAKTRGEGFGPEVRRRIILGTFVLSAGYADAFYRKARDVRAVIRRDFARAFESVSAIATPTTPTPAFVIGAKSDPLAMYAEDVFTVPANLAGIPAISVPNGTVVRDSKALPIGFQLMAAHGGEETLFAIGSDVEKIARAV